MEDWGILIDGFVRHIGQTVTVFTTSGGLSGSGFTGVLLSVDPGAIRLLCDVGAAPACAVGSACEVPAGRFGFGGAAYANPLGAIAIIPLRTIACFTHNAI